MRHKHLWMMVLLSSVVLLMAAGAAPATAPAAEAPAAETPAAEAPAAEGPCAPATEGEWAGVDPSGQTVIWWHNHTGSRDEQLTALLAQFDECGITVVSQSQGGYDEIRDKVNASIAAGEQPAALIAGYQNDQAFYQLNDALVDLNTLIDDPKWGLTPEDKADFYASFFDQGVHPAFGGQRLGFPPNRSMEMIYYNQTWLEELGFDGPPTTPDEFREMACAAAEAKGDGSGGFILRDDASAVAAWTLAFGGDILNEEGTSYVYNSQATIDAMTWLKGMYDDGCAFFFTEGYPNTEFAARNAIFAMGSSSGIPFYATDIQTIAEQEGRDPDEWGVAAVPHTTPDPVQNVYGGDVMIVKTTPEQELAAWLFIKWFTTPEIQAEWVRISGYFPTRAGTAEFLGDYINENVQWGQALALLPYGSYEPQLISYQATRDAATQAFNEIMQGADIQTTIDALTGSANEMQEELMAEVE
jgi:multiple sugar transport system substrate-binding protein